MTATSGPLPPPEVLGLYERISPGLAAEIVLAFKAEYTHRHTMDEKALQADLEIAKQGEGHVRRGQYCAFVIAMGGIIGGAWLIFAGHDAAGASLAGLPLASILAAFLKSSSKPKP